ncbi:uncharacterized protein LOC130199172 isoform X2 [Pseudoliparis swirei]|uniref:uncharacterized protein LOC130199172 isoform X2 n=1 Tax=Pseudoliparis swirei TaxID=2059687 RepID=UPI0024BE847F|nr:uncharacterized protein LOC130199172 isoform X2 [Pseudoliparis swirei]
METKNINMAENVDEEQCDDKSKEVDLEGGEVMNRNKTPEQDYSSSEGETEDEEDNMGTGEKAEALSRLVCCGNKFCEGNKEDRIFTEGQPLAPQGAENHQVRNKEPGESESDDEVSYFESVPERGSEMVMRGDGIEEDEQEREKETKEDLCNSERESMIIEQEEAAVLALCREQKPENPSVVGAAKANLEFPDISVQHLQDLFTEVDSEMYGEKMKDFSGEEHQDAGESFADYPSDFSSCEYVEDGGTHREKKHQSNPLACASDTDSIKEQQPCQERVVTDVMWMGRAEDTEEEGDGYMHSRDVEEDANEFRSLDVADRDKYIVVNVSGDAAVTAIDDGGANGERDSYTSIDDEVQVKKSDEELLDCMRQRDLESNKQLQETRGESGAALSDDYDRVDAAEFNNYWNLDVLATDNLLSEDLFTTEDTDEADTPPSDVTQCCAEDGNSLVQRVDAQTTNPSSQGSLDDRFFFNTEHEPSGIMETGQLGEDEDEEERNWELEQKIIKAFYEFYDDSDGEKEREVYAFYRKTDQSSVLCRSTVSSHSL